MISRIVFFMIGSMFALCASAQDDPVKWTFTSKSTDNGMYEIHVSAVIENGWRLYAQSSNPNGPMPASITINKNPLIVLEGKTSENGEPWEKYEPAFGVEVKYYKHKVDFIQVIRLKHKVKTNVTGVVSYMTCNDEKCLPSMEKKFSISIKP